MKNSVSHLAGLDVVIGGRQIQRCAICGEKLIDSKGAMAPNKPDGSPPDPIPFWTVGAMIRVEFNGPVSHWSVVDREPREDVNKPGKIPHDSCLELVE